MLRHEAIRTVLNVMTDQELLVFANGYISRDGFNYGDSPRRFYMLGSMGHAGSIGLGICLAKPKSRVIVLDGDGNLLMGLSMLPMVGMWQPNHFLHVVLDNGTYGSTGSQPTVSTAVNFPKLALASGYRRAASVHTLYEIQEKVQDWMTKEGPSLLHVKVSKEEPCAFSRVFYEPVEIARRFTKTCLEV
ncbi:sulfopyruvate decarboxylase subunit beta [Bacillus thuringiensis]|uniref:thiamine pyrophosphate-dependent enzyme n=1 Tax=Bacillus thuringiensis TaxID=1428 RepID=UPI000BFB3810|nr:thiamine pyrophosphate-dependent enzyme [Bacillus thuringiensis]PGH72154.1 sulfopyruvate decarboxylase subunit beta [Bacillus thuringiensis]